MKHYLIPIFFTCIFRNFQKILNAKLFGISEISCYHLKGDSEYFSQKNQRCPKSTHKLPISPFSKYHKNRTISPFSSIFLRNSKNPNHRMVDLTLAYKMKIRFTKISQSPRRLSVKHYLIPIFYMYFSEFSKFLNANLFGISKISCFHLKGDCAV